LARLLIAVIDLPISLQVEGVLNAWFAKAKDDDIDFLDFVLFKVIKYLPENNSIRKQWIDRCVELALNVEHPSLIESLILTLKQEALKNSKLVAIASKLAKDSKQMQRVLLNACDLKINGEG